MAQTALLETVHVGLIASEPLRVEGLRGVFEPQPQGGQASLVPVIGALEDLLTNPSLGYLILDLNAFPLPVETLRMIARAKSVARLIVIGPDKDEKLVIEAIFAGARAFVDATAGPRLIREAIEVALSGSIWAPRRTLAFLIDRLMEERSPHSPGSTPQLTHREQQVLDLILLARSNREIAAELGIEERTVKSHVGKLMRKIGVENRIALSMHALRGPAAGNQN